MKYTTRTVLLFLLAFLLSACGGSSSSSNGGETNTSTDDNAVIETKFVGIWDQTEEIQGETDVIYLYIGSDGVATEYDYDGDSFDQGENCYYIYRNEFSLTRNGANYTFTQENETFSTSLSISNDVFKLTALENSGALDIVKGDQYLVGKRTSGLSVTDFDNIECQ